MVIPSKFLLGAYILFSHSVWCGNCDASVSLLQAAAKYRMKSPHPASHNRTLREVHGLMEFNLADVNEASWLTASDDDVNADVCGARPVVPQLQLEIEVFRIFGMMKSLYTRCRVPSTSNLLSYTQLDETRAYRRAKDLIKSRPGLAQSMRSKGARLVVVFWAIAAIITIATYVISAAGSSNRERDKEKMEEKAKVAWSQRSIGGVSLSWLDPIVNLYRSKDASEIEEQEVNAIEPDFQFEPYGVFRRLWQDEVAMKGIDEASLTVTVRRFVGFEVALKMAFTVGAAACLELAGMTVVLDLLLNYLRWASDAHIRLPFVTLDTLGPAMMVICLGFGVPMGARYLISMANICDGFCTSRIQSGLLSMVFEKCQRLPMSEAEPGEVLLGNGSRIDVTQLISNDIVKVWNCVVKSYTQLVVYPLCGLFFAGFLWQRLGYATLCGACVVLVFIVLYPLSRDLVRRGNQRWLRLTDARARLMKDSMFNMRSVKALKDENCLSERIYTVRDQELQSKLGFTMVLNLLNVPITLLPFAFVCSSLLFHISLHQGRISTQDIFVCMQVLAGMVSCSTTIGGAIQRTITLPNSLRRLETFLKETEKPKKTSQQTQARHPSAPVVQVCGSFGFGQDPRPVLHDIDFVVRKGELVAIVGDVGSGKSALMSTILGELNGTNPLAKIDAPEHVAFCAQTPWLTDGLLHENITMGETVERKRYEEALAVASLKTNALDEDRTDEQAKLPPQAEEKDLAEPAPFAYFAVWNVMVAIALMLGVINVNWQKTPVVLGVVIVIIQGLLHWSVMEIPLQTIFTFFAKEAPKPVRGDGSKLTLCLNYNLLAVSQADVDECMYHMYDAYMGSVSENVSACLVSATNDPDLKEYELQVRDDCRDRIYKELVHEGLAWAGLEEGTVDPGRRLRVWSKYAHIDKQEFAQQHLTPLCKRFAREFMVVHRVSRVLRKCGQYQDLMLLSAGLDKAFTYCDRELYREAARPLGEPLFHPSDDTDNVFERFFDYTLVLDADTGVKPDSVFDLLDIGAGNPERAIIQPAIEMDCRPGDSIFIHVEAMRQTINAPLTNTLTALLGECGFYGKGLIKNEVYIEKCLGTPEAPIEVVPIDVLSHDTFEAAVVGPLYAGDVNLLEAPCGNYVTWDIRERRWNRGEILLAMYFFPKWVGAPMTWVMQRMQGKKFNTTTVRTKAELGPVSTYLAHAPLRQIALKPLLVIYIIMMDFVNMHYQWTPFLVVMFLIIVFPKFATATRSNIKAVLLETTASILQFTPECMVGTIRILRALKAHLTGNARWVPQRAVEEEFEESNPFIFSLNYLWYYPCFALMSGILVASLIPDGIFIMWMLGTLFTLPIYAGFTALKTRAEDEEPSPFPYFRLWNVFASSALILGIMNVDWSRTPLLLGVVVVALQGLLHWSVMEIPLQTVATFFTKEAPKPVRGDGSKLTMCLNYNLLAVGTADIDECMENQEIAYMGNISENVSACLVSATNDPQLKEYELQVRDECRERIYKKLVHEGLVWAGFEHGKVDPGRHQRVWSKFQHIERQEFAQVHLTPLCQRFAKEFMVVHRVSRVLRKCGQYQDLMLLSAGEENAFTYCDKKLYGDAARPFGQPLFYPSEDVDNVRGRNFDYTLVLDADTGVVKDSVFEMLDIGAGNPERAIIQPSIKMDCKPGDSIFIHVEAMRQSITAPLTNCLTALLKESGFYGKGVVKNSVYIDKCLGTPEQPIEVVPIDVLSHDTFEAAVVGPLYAGDIHLLEAPCGNYVTWDIRERRWNRGEILLASYFFPKYIGEPMQWLMEKLQGKTFNKTQVRTKAQLSEIAEYLAHSALRQIMLKPMLVMYIVLMDFVEMHYEWTPFLTAMFLIIVFPKIATCNRSNLRAVVLETTASILQFTPECVVGTIRILRALKAHLTGNARWIPQRAVEEEFEESNPFVFSLNYLWYYPCFALVAGVIVCNLIPDGIFIMWMLGTLFTLPFYAGFTALRTPKKDEVDDADDPAEEIATTTKKRMTDGTANDPNSADAWLQPVTIGPQGSFLSSGEKAQVAFARAAYCPQGEVVLFDDPFGSVDAAVGNHLMDSLVGSSLFDGRARIVAMPLDSKHLHRFDRVVVLDGGRVKAQGTADEVLALPGVRRMRSGHEAAYADPPIEMAASGPKVVGTLATSEELQEVVGEQRWRVLGDVLAAGGPQRLIFATIIVFASRIVLSGLMLLLGVWADRKDAAVGTHDSYYVHAMAIGVFFAGVLQALQTYFVLSFNNAASQSLFNRVFESLMRAPLDAFWGRQPTGRVLNRLSGDMLTIDASFSSGFFALSSFVFNIAVQQVYCLAVMPRWLVVPMYVALTSFTVFFWKTSTPLQYFSAMQLSKVHDQQAHAIESSASARAYRHTNKQIAKFCGHASAAVKPTFFGVVCAKQWLMFRITFCLCFQCTICILGAILRPNGFHVAMLAMIALSTFNIIQDLDGFVDTIINGMSVGISLQRMTEYIRKQKHSFPLEDHPQRDQAAQEIVQESLANGARMRVQNLRVGYARASTDAISDVSFDLAPGSFLGVFGPAGSGKTALLLGISQVLKPRDGEVTFANLDLGDRVNVSPELLRGLVRYLAQEPAIFTGSVRFNLDPSGDCSNERIWEILRCVQLAEVVETLDGGLDHWISKDGGGGLSFGHRQLLCFARAICVEPAVLLVDNSLSGVDEKTQVTAWHGVRRMLPKTSVVVAAQRPRGTCKFDELIILDKGVVVSRGSPQTGVEHASLTR